MNLILTQLVTVVPPLSSDDDSSGHGTGPDLQFLDDHTNPVTGKADNEAFLFTSFGLSASGLEILRIFVGELGRWQ